MYGYRENDNINLTRTIIFRWMVWKKKKRDLYSKTSFPVHYWFIPASFIRLYDAIKICFLTSYRTQNACHNNLLCVLHTSKYIYLCVMWYGKMWCSYNIYFALCFRLCVQKWCLCFIYHTTYILGGVYRLRCYAFCKFDALSCVLCTL